MMNALDNLPFLTDDFTPRGGGIDFLGLRVINLNILSNNLLNGINNATQDIGTFCLALWMSWKFRNMTVDRRSEYNEENFAHFIEAIQVLIAETMKDDSPSTKRFGKTRNRIGTEQTYSYDELPRFNNVSRTYATDIYAAALYGPSMRYLNFIKGKARSINNTPMNIQLANDDSDTETIAQSVDSCLRNSSYYNIINHYKIGIVNESEMNNLGLHGMNPAYYKHEDLPVLKATFARKLLPIERESLGYTRTKTARLILNTLEKGDKQTTESLRKIWYTNLFPDGRTLILKDQEIELQRDIWSVFMSRQYQRYILELMLKCFEIGIVEGLKTINDIVNYFLIQQHDFDSEYPKSFLDLVEIESQRIFSNHNSITNWELKRISSDWNSVVHGDHEYFEDMDFTESKVFSGTLVMLARWWIRMISWKDNTKLSEFMRLGKSDRISIMYLINWIYNRKDQELRSFLNDFYSELIYSQHMRVALNRYDGQIQRLRFYLGDNGIEQASNVRIAQQSEQWMSDRLDAFIGLLVDLNIIKFNSDETISVAEKHHSVPM